MGTRLYRSSTDKMVGGVCGGLGRYLGIDPAFIRIFFLLLAFGEGAGVWIYFLLWIVLPSDAQTSTSFSDTVHANADEVAQRAQGMGQEFQQVIQNPNPKAGLYVGIGLLALGVFFLLQNMHLIGFNLDVLWPVVLIAAGVALLLRRSA